MRLRTLLAVTVAAAAVTTARAAAAQTTVGGYSLNQLDPAPAGDALFGVPAPWVGGHLVPRGYVMFDYAHEPLRFRSAAGAETPIVAAQGFLRADVSLALWDRLLVSADMPIAIVQSGQDPGVTGIDFHPPTSAAAGDLRLGLRGRIAGEYRSPFQLGVGGNVFVPTAPKLSYSGEGAVRGSFQFLLGGRAGENVGFVWNAAGGVMLRGSTNPHAITYGGGAALTLGRELLQFSAEIFGATPVGGTPLAVPGIEVGSGGTNLEVLFGTKLRVLRGLTFGGAVGPGLLTAAGTPVFRAVGMIGWAPPPDARDEPKKVVAIGDRDNDGIRDDVDACPDVKGELQADPSKDGCPPADRDKDGILDVDDACPGIAGVGSADATKNGCPGDADGDGIHDGVDACPAEKGAVSDDKARNGCPPDNDKDGVIDVIDACPALAGPASKDPRQNGCPEDPDGDGIKFSADACPNEKGVSDPDPRQNGCPKAPPPPKTPKVAATPKATPPPAQPPPAQPPPQVVTSAPPPSRSTSGVAGDGTPLAGVVRFMVGGKGRKETLEPLTSATVDEVREALRQPGVLYIEVQGHADDSGSEEYNQQLSDTRAENVRQWLIDAGIPGDKLVAKGYGFNVPIADNRIRTGRDLNRRVQFSAVKKR